MKKKQIKLGNLLTDRQSKDLTTKSSSLNEAVNFKANIDDPNDDIRGDKQAASKFKWVPNTKPVTIDRVELNKKDGKTEVTLHFSNADKIYYKDNGHNLSYSMIFVGRSDRYKVSNNIIDKSMNYAKTTVGGVALIYSIFKNGKKSSSFNLY